MAKKQEKKSQGGKQNPVRFGDVGKATVASEGGRARKRADRRGHEVMREQRFAQLVAQAGPKEMILPAMSDSSLVGELVKVDLLKEVEVRVEKTVENPHGLKKTVVEGTIVLEIIDNTGRPAIKVVGSNFSPIVVSDVFLPIDLLLKEIYRPYLRGGLHVKQVELHTALRFALKLEIDAWLRAGQVLVTPGVTVPKLAPSKKITVLAEAIEAKKEKSPPLRKLTWRRIKGEVGYWNSGFEFFDITSNGSVTIRQDLIAGARKLTFLNVGKNHPLFNSWEKVGKAEVQVDIAEVFPKGLTIASNAGDTPMRAARREFAQYLALRYTELKAADPLVQQVGDPLESSGVTENEFLRNTALLLEKR